MLCILNYNIQQSNKNFLRDSSDQVPFLISEELLNIITCPETKQTLSPAKTDTVEKINGLIEKGEIQNRCGEEIEDRIDGGLIREDGKYIYPVRNGIPVLLIDEAISPEEVS